MRSIFYLVQEVKEVQANGMDFYSVPSNYEVGEGMGTVVTLALICIGLVSILFYSAYRRKKRNH